MFSLILSICFISGSIEICEEEVKAQAMPLEECSYHMDMLMHDIKHGPFYNFGWTVQCTKEEE